jgi:hypothetical protein
MYNLLEIILDIVKVTVPALIVYYTVKTLFGQFLEQQLQKEQSTQRIKQQEMVLPLRLQAYERLSLFCERISPPNLLLRVRPDGLSVAELRVALMMNIQQEYEHNVTQQVYVSEQLWQILKIARDDSVSMIAMGAEQLDPKADARLLAERIFTLLEQRGNTTGLDTALQAIKTEAAGMMSN